MHDRRGQPAMEAMQILPALHGRAMHDGWKSYFVYPCAHALCNGHHLRELEFLQERYPQAWETGLIDLLLEIKEAVERSTTAHRSRLSPAQRKAFEKRYDALRQRGYRANPAPARPGSEDGSNDRLLSTCWTVFGITKPQSWLLCMILRFRLIAKHPLWIITRQNEISA